MLATVGDDTWNVLNIQHMTSNSDTPGGGHKKFKGPAHIVEGGNQAPAEKPPNLHPREGHGWDQSLKSQLGSNILSTHILLVSCQSTLLFLW